MVVQDSDWPLVEALQAGQENALNLLMMRHQEGIFRFIFRYVLHEHDARDLTQEVFIRVYFKIGEFKPKAKFTTWLYRIAANLCHDHARSRVVRKKLCTDSIFPSTGDNHFLECQIPSTDVNPSDMIESKEKMKAVGKAIDELPHDLKVALILAVLEERPHTECAEILNTTPKTIETRVYRARKYLMRKLIHIHQ